MVGPLATLRLVKFEPPIHSEIACVSRLKGQYAISAMKLGDPILAVKS
jgi:hypothetical protein